MRAVLCASLQPLTFSCPVTSKTGSVKACAWTFAGSYAFTDPKTAAIGVDAPAFVCHVAPKTTSVKLIALLQSSADAIHETLPGTTGSLYDALVEERRESDEMARRRRRADSRVRRHRRRHVLRRRLRRSARAPAAVRDHALGRQREELRVDLRRQRQRVALSPTRGAPPRDGARPREMICKPHERGARSNAEGGA